MEHTFSLDEARALLDRTPAVLDALLRDLPEPWIRADEGADTWSVFDVVGHLIHGERTDWIARARIILEHGETRPFDKFDRFAQFAESKGKTLDALLDEFAALRRKSLGELAALHLTETALDRRGSHPALGAVTLRQLLATWVAHDLDHLTQIARVMAGRYSDEVGPWQAYLRVISGKQG
jgi:uncharacterized damage-inducible protein DinB